MKLDEARYIKYVVGSTHLIDCGNAFNQPLSCVLEKCTSSPVIYCFLDHPLSVHVALLLHHPIHIY